MEQEDKTISYEELKRGAESHGWMAPSSVEPALVQSTQEEEEFKLHGLIKYNIVFPFIRTELIMDENV